MGKKGGLPLNRVAALFCPNGEERGRGSPCSPCWGRGGELKLLSIPSGADYAWGPPAAGQRATASLVRSPSRRGKGGEPPLPSPLHSSYGVGEEEPPSGAHNPPSARGWVSLVGPHRPQQRRQYHAGHREDQGSGHV
ncbi:hypothetical protein Sjap_024430 [Stephania japonica]|uniref:Uncharacterized protein n=1 Tax=Stephania japonica TaxID=461633 RepID=A0AAP0EKL4_9MAGN